jgi:hypothetical protein
MPKCLFRSAGFSKLNNNPDSPCSFSIPGSLLPQLFLGAYHAAVSDLLLIQKEETKFMMCFLSTTAKIWSRRYCLLLVFGMFMDLATVGINGFNIS